VITLLACGAPAVDPGDSDVPTAAECGEPEFVAALAHLFVGEADACEVAWYVDQLDQIEANRAGPWQERLWRMHGDGPTMDLAGSVALREHAAVPEVVLGDDGRVYLFFVEGDLEFGRSVAQSGGDWFKEHGIIGYGAIDAMVSDDGVSFEPLADFGIGGLVPGFVADPDVIRLGDGRWRMYYVGQRVEELAPMTDEAPINADTIFFAESDDLVRWEQLGEAAVGLPADPSVSCVGPECLLAATGLLWGRSTDAGLRFTITDTPQLGGFAPELVADDVGLTLYFNSVDLGGALMYAQSTDFGLTWTEPVVSVDICLAEAPSLLADPAGGAWVYYHYYTGGRSGSDFGDHANDTAYPDPCDAVEDPRAEPT
jgi:hypothetical protein